ncbi:MAG: hypothetical protein R3176_06490 [Woeseiaceae bacterium]|nr:hypothetical protein [Woeseiaceae bacterium]
MLDSASPKAANFETGTDRPTTGPLLTRKIWLPKPLYAALPYFYILVGLLALAATIYINEWFWVVPHWILFSAACLHMGLLVGRRRHRARNEES